MTALTVLHTDRTFPYFDILVACFLTHFTHNKPSQYFCKKSRVPMSFQKDKIFHSLLASPAPKQVSWNSYSVTTVRNFCLHVRAKHPRERRGTASFRLKRDKRAANLQLSKLLLPVSNPLCFSQFSETATLQKGSRRLRNQWRTRKWPHRQVLSKSDL